MAFKKNNFFDLRGIISLVILAIPLTAATNIDCDGKAFHCVNSTHFMICVDLGSGISSTIDDFVIPCPPRTVCHTTNRFECEFAPVNSPPSLAPPLNVISVNGESGASDTTAKTAKTTVGSTILEEINNTVSTSTIIIDIVTQQPEVLFKTTLGNNKSAKYTEINLSTEPLTEIESGSANVIETGPTTEIIDNAIITEPNKVNTDINTITTVLNETLSTVTVSEVISTTESYYDIVTQDVTILAFDSLTNEKITTTDAWNTYTTPDKITTGISMIDSVKSSTAAATTESIYTDSFGDNLPYKNNDNNSFIIESLPTALNINSNTTVLNGTSSTFPVAEVSSNTEADNVIRPKDVTVLEHDSVWTEQVATMDSWNDYNYPNEKNTDISVTDSLISQTADQLVATTENIFTDSFTDSLPYVNTDNKSLIMESLPIELNKTDTIVPNENNYINNISNYNVDYTMDEISNKTTIESLAVTTDDLNSQYKTSKFDHASLATESFPISTDNTEIFAPEVVSTIIPDKYVSTEPSKKLTEYINQSRETPDSFTNENLMETTNTMHVTENITITPAYYETNNPNTRITTDMVFADNDDMSLKVIKKTSMKNAVNSTREDAIDILITTEKDLLIEPTLQQTTYSDISLINLLPSLPTSDFIQTTENPSTYMDQETIQSLSTNEIVSIDGKKSVLSGVQTPTDSITEIIDLNTSEEATIRKELTTFYNEDFGIDDINVTSFGYYTPYTEPPVNDLRALETTAVDNTVSNAMLSQNNIIQDLISTTTEYVAFNLFQTTTSSPVEFTTEYTPNNYTDEQILHNQRISSVDFISETNTNTDSNNMNYIPKDKAEAILNDKVQPEKVTELHKLDFTTEIITTPMDIHNSNRSPIEVADTTDTEVKEPIHLSKISFTTVTEDNLVITNSNNEPIDTTEIISQHADIITSFTSNVFNKEVNNIILGQTSEISTLEDSEITLNYPNALKPLPKVNTESESKFNEESVIGATFVPISNAEFSATIPANGVSTTNYLQVNPSENIQKNIPEPHTTVSNNPISTPLEEITQVLLNDNDSSTQGSIDIEQRIESVPLAISTVYPEIAYQNKNDITTYVTVPDFKINTNIDATPEALLFNTQTPNEVHLNPLLIATKKFEQGSVIPILTTLPSPFQPIKVDSTDYKHNSDSQPRNVNIGTLIERVESRTKSPEISSIDVTVSLGTLENGPASDALALITQESSTSTSNIKITIPDGESQTVDNTETQVPISISESDNGDKKYFSMPANTPDLKSSTKTEEPIVITSFTQAHFLDESQNAKTGQSTYNFRTQDLPSSTPQSSLGIGGASIQNTETEIVSTTVTKKSTVITLSTSRMFVSNDSQNNQQIKADIQTRNITPVKNFEQRIDNAHISDGNLIVNGNGGVVSRVNNKDTQKRTDSVTAGQQESINNIASSTSTSDVGAQVTSSIIAISISQDNKLHTDKNMPTSTLRSAKDQVLNHSLTSDLSLIKNNTQMPVLMNFNNNSQKAYSQNKHPSQSSIIAVPNVQNNVEIHNQAEDLRTRAARNSGITNNTSRGYDNHRTSEISQSLKTQLNVNRGTVNQPYFSCNHYGRGRYGDKKECRKFYICVGRYQPIVGMCPINTVFSEFRKQCTKNISHCIRNNDFLCSSEGRFPDYFNENVFYICMRNTSDTFARFKLQCQAGFYLNKISVRCVLKPKGLSPLPVSSAPSTLKPFNSDSTSTSEQSKTLTPKESHKRKREKFECEEEGKFADPNDCKKYYYCYKNKKDEFRIKKKRCESEEVFDEEKQKCTETSSRES